MIKTANDPDAHLYIPVLNNEILNNVTYVDEELKAFKYVDPCDLFDSPNTVHEVVNVDIKIYRLDDPVIANLPNKKFGCKCKPV